MKGMILNEIGNENFKNTVDQSIIKRNRKNGEKICINVTRIYTDMYTIKVVHDDFTTTPYDINFHVFFFSILLSILVLFNIINICSLF